MQLEQVTDSLEHLLPELDQRIARDLAVSNRLTSTKAPSDERGSEKSAVMA